MLISRSKSSPPTARVNAPGEAPYPNMSWIPGGTFRMGSEKYYPEERPVHRVTVYGFWIDCTPVTNREFHRFVETTGYVTFAEIQPEKLSRRAAGDASGWLARLHTAESSREPARLGRTVALHLRRKLAATVRA
jgi:formylglycine-generating enzyme required for sulfatase activity